MKNYIESKSDRVIFKIRNEVNLLEQIKIKNWTI